MKFLDLNRHKTKSASLLILTPFLDVLTVLLIFLMVTFSPDEASIEIDAKLKLPEATHNLKNVPHLRVELMGDQVKVNGEIVQGLALQQATSESWNILKKILKDQKKENETAVLLVADRSTSYKFIDMTAALVAAAGYADIYFLTEMKHQEGEIK